MRALQKEARQRERAVVVNVLRRAQVVLATCVGAGSKILKDCAFDMVVIDEAAQGLEAACWVPIMKLNAERGGKVVLAGGHSLYTALYVCWDHNHVFAGSVKMAIMYCVFITAVYV